MDEMKHELRKIEDKTDKNSEPDNKREKLNIDIQPLDKDDRKLHNRNKRDEREELVEIKPESLIYIYKNNIKANGNTNN